MQLVGATQGFIRRPFVTRGILHGIYSALIAILLIMLVMYYLQSILPDLIQIQDIEILAYLFAAFWLLIVTFILWPYDSSAGEWNDKPVMCEHKEIALEAVKAKGEIPFITAVQSTKVRDQDGLSDIPAHVFNHVIDSETYVS